MATKRDERFERMRAEAEDNIKIHATSLFARQGFNRTTMKDIAADAGVSVGLAYRYFPSKHELFDSIIRDAIAGLRDLVSVFESKGDPKETMSTIVHEMWTSMDEVADNELFWLVSQSLFPSSGQNPMMKDLMEVDKRLIASIASLIERGQKLGEFKAGDSHLLAVYFVSAYQGLGMFTQVFDIGLHEMKPDVFLRFLFDE